MAYKMLGDVFIQMKQSYNAIFLYQKAIRLFMELKNLTEISVLNTRIAHVYQVLGKKQLTLEYNIKAYNERIQSGSLGLVASSIINIGGAYMELGRFDSAEYYLNRGLKKSLDENRSNLIEEVYQLLADCYGLQGNYKLSLEYYQKYHNYHLKILADRNKGLIHTLETDHLIRDIENTHSLLTKQNETHDAQLRNHRLQLLFIGILLFLALTVGLVVHSLTLRTKKAEENLQLLNLKLENEIKEHIEAVRGLQMSESIYRFLAENSADVISLFDKNIKRKFISPSCLSFYGYTEEELLTRPDSLEVVDLSYRKQVRSSLESMLTGKTAKTLVYKVRKKDGTTFWVEGHINPMFNPATGEVNEMVSVVRDISDRVAYEEQLAMNERQKELLLYEIHHRVKNNFAILISLMELQRQFSPEKTLDMPITDLQLRVRTMSLVHEQLYHNQSIDSIPLGAYLERLTAIISSAFSKPNVKIHTSIMECAARIEIALPIGLIVNELLTNSFKYAFPDKMSGNIWIDLRIGSTKSRADQGLDSIFYILSLRDDGIGIQKDFSFDENVSTGSQIIKILIEQLEAEYEITPGPGFHFILKFAAFPKEYN
jgi:PAS domain S-box-containing protein